MYSTPTDSTPKSPEAQNRSSQRSPLARLAVTTLLAVFGVGGIACEDASQIFVIRGQIAAQPATQGGACVYTAGASVGLQLGSVLDVSIRNGYQAVYNVQNQLVPRQDNLNSRAEVNRIRINGAEVTLTDGAGATLASFRGLSTQVVVDPQGFAAVGVNLVDPQTSVKLKSSIPVGQSQEIVARVKMFGTTLGNTEVQSAEFQQIINVCNKCLAFFPPEATDPSLVTPQQPRNCSAILEPKGDAPCSVGQDATVDCRFCRGNPGCQP
jgi:hypothetical protein